VKAQGWTRRRRALALALAACATAAIATSVAWGATPTYLAPMKKPKTCGQDAKFIHKDPDGALKKLPAAVQKRYDAYPYEIKATPWSSFAGKPMPWKIGFVSFPIDNTFMVGFYDQLKKDFALAQSKGLVTGSLKTYIQPSWNTATPEQQSAAIQQMVRDGVTGIVLQPLNLIAETPAIEAAGKAGIPIVFASGASPISKYAINVTQQNAGPSFSATLANLQKRGFFDGTTRNALISMGPAGQTWAIMADNLMRADLAPCKGLKIVGEITSGWNVATAKAETLKFLASHPEKIDFFAYEGADMAGIIAAFEQAGRPVPPMPFDGGTTGGDLAWWAKKRATYKDAVGYVVGGKQVAYTEFRILLRVLGGKKLKLRDIHIQDLRVDASTVHKHSNPKDALETLSDFKAPANGWGGSNAFLNAYFAKPGTPGGL
jgi:ABC-type sugar transport system substrate-binding protein